MLPRSPAQLEIGDKKLGEYVKTVLLMEEAEFGSNIISKEVSPSISLPLKPLLCLCSVHIRV